MSDGKVFTISSFANARIKFARELRLKKNRRKHKLFLVEGQKIIIDALNSDWQIKTFLCEKNTCENLAAKLRQHGADVLFVSPEILSKITARENAANCLAIVSQKIRNINSLQKNGTLLALERVRDSGNLGTIIRTAHAFDVDGLILVGDCTDLFSLETIRASMGSIFSIPIFFASENEFINFMKKFRGTKIATHLAATTSLRNYSHNNNSQLIIMGNEQQGVSDAICNCCDQLLKINMKENADSLNLAVATAITLYELQRH